MHHARGNLEIVANAHRRPFRAHPCQQRLQGQGFRLEVNLQRADPRRQVDDPRPGLRLQRLHQRVDTKAQNQIQLRLSGLQQ